MEVVREGAKGAVGNGEGVAAYEAVDAGKGCGVLPCSDYGPLFLGVFCEELHWWIQKIQLC